MKSNRYLHVLALFVFFLVFTLNVHAQKTVPNSQQQVTYSFAPLVKKATPAVVNIYTNKVVRYKYVSPFLNDPFFKRFFGKGLLGRERSKKQSSLGSGVIVSKDGLVITSYHVIRGADEISVTLSDRREFKAKLIIGEEKSDLALLRLQNVKASLPYLELADSDNLEVGDMVLAIGNPFGVGQTVTSGIISAVARTTVGISDYQFFIQTDAAINPGNSGGALVNMDGKMLGVNTAIYTKSGGSHGIGFAIPANMVQTVIRSSYTGNNKVVRPWLGVSTQSVTQDIANSIGLKSPQGAMISHVHPDGPAAKAGIKVGDVVIAVDEHTIVDDHGLRFRAATHEIGSKAKFTLIRNGRQRAVYVTMETPPEEPKRNTLSLSGRHPFDGVTVMNLSPAVADEIDLHIMSEGVVISEMASGYAARFGLRKKDIIKEINGWKIDDTQDLKQLLDTKKVSNWDVKIIRGKRLLKFSWSIR